MNTLKCPLCGNDLDLWCDTALWDRHAQLYVDAYYYLCEDCALSTMPVPSKEKAIEQVAKFISNLPPIMRVNVGDKILYNSCDDDYLAKVNEICRDKNNDVYLKVIILDNDDEDDVEAHQIIRWPWELEQEGGQQ